MCDDISQPVFNWQVAVKAAIHRKIFSKSYYINAKSDCIYHFPNDLAPNRRPFGAKSDTI